MYFGISASVLIAFLVIPAGGGVSSPGVDPNPCDGCAGSIITPYLTPPTCSGPSASLVSNGGVMQDITSPGCTENAAKDDCIRNNCIIQGDTTFQNTQASGTLKWDYGGNNGNIPWVPNNPTASRATIATNNDPVTCAESDTEALIVITRTHTNGDVCKKTYGWKCSGCVHIVNPF